MKYLYLILAICSFTLFSQAQSADWAKGIGTSATNTGDKTNKSVIDANGNAYVVGQIDIGSVNINTDVLNNSNNSGSNGFLAKYDSSGTAQWGVFLDCPDGGDATGIAIDNSGNIYITGTFTDSIEVDPKGSGNMLRMTSRYLYSEDFYVAKYNSNGILQWATFMQTENGSMSRDLALDASGNVYVTGEGYGTLYNNNASDSIANSGNIITPSPFIAKFNTSGNFVSGTIIQTGQTNNGAKTFDIEMGSDGHLVIAGSTQDSLTFNPTGNSFTRVPDMTNGAADIFLAKYNTSLTALWARIIGGEDEDEAYAISINDTSGIWLSGRMQNSFSVGSSSLTSNGGSDIIIAHIDSNGTAKHAFNVGGSGTDEAFDIYVENNGFVWVTGVFTGSSVDFDPDGTTKNLNGGSSEEAFLASYDLDGKIEYALAIGDGGSSPDKGLGISRRNNAMILTGYYGSSSSNFNPSGTSLTLTHQGDKDAFVTRYIAQQCLVGNADPIQGNSKICIGSRTIFSIPKVANATQYTWRITGDPQTIVSGQGTNTIVLEATATGVNTSTLEVIPSDATCSGAPSSIQLSGYNPPTFDNITPSNPICGKDNGNISVTMNGGGSFSYIWSNGDTVSNPQGMASGAYYVTATSSNSTCSVDSLIILTDNGAPSITSSSKVSDVKCYGDSTGSIDMELTGGSPPYIINWSNGDTTEDVSGLQAGGYRVVVADSAGCRTSKIFIVGQPQKLSVSTSVTPVSACGVTDGGATAAATGGVGGYTFSWSNSTSGSSLAAVAAATYFVTVTDTNGCKDSTWADVTDSKGPTITLDSMTVPDCQANNGAIFITGNFSLPISYSWSNSSNNEDLTGVDGGVYTVSATSGSCVGVKTWRLNINPPAKNEVCIVTVDDTTKKNVCAFEKVQKSGLSHYNFYRESWQPGVYIKLGKNPADSASWWEDPTADPKLKAWRYKIAAVNKCGVESELSDYHQTIHLVVKKSDTTKADLTWSNYQGFAYTQIFIDRFTQDSGWSTIDSVPFTQSSYVDNNPPVDKTLEYALGIDHPNGCFASRAQSRNLNSSRSNRSAPPFVGSLVDTGKNPVDTTISLPGINRVSSIKVFPNPVRNNLTLSFGKEEGAYAIEIINALGSVVFRKERLTATQNEEQTINFEGFETGIYILKLTPKEFPDSPYYYRILKN
jgi:hypothetical protein